MRKALGWCIGLVVRLQAFVVDETGASEEIAAARDLVGRVAPLVEKA